MISNFLKLCAFCFCRQEHKYNLIKSARLYSYNFLHLPQEKFVKWQRYSVYFSHPVLHLSISANLPILQQVLLYKNCIGFVYIQGLHGYFLFAQFIQLISQRCFENHDSGIVSVYLCPWSQILLMNFTTSELIFLCESKSKRVSGSPKTLGC